AAMKVMKTGFLTDPQFALLIVVSVIVFHALIVGVPLVYSFYLSFQDYNAILRSSEYVGWDNFTTVLTDPEVMHSTWVTLEFAAPHTIPPDLSRAARLHRAGLGSRLRHVTLPHIKYAVLIVLVVVTVEAFREFDTLFSMTLGGPGTATLTLPLLIFRYNFQFS